MSGDDQPPRIQPIGSERVNRATEWRRREHWAQYRDLAEEERREREQQGDSRGESDRASTPQPTPVDTDAELADDLAKQELQEPDRMPDEIEQRSEIHDAARHGDPIARAIEAAQHPPDPPQAG